MWIIKIGGSWLKNPSLPSLLVGIKKICNKDIVIVPGGGSFADSVRDVYDKTKMSENLANKLALKSTELFAEYLKELDNDLCLIENPKNFTKEEICVWLPSKKLSQNNSFKNNWDSTSDSVAAWLANKIMAEGIIFIKSLKDFKSKNKLYYLQNKNILDKNISIYLSGYNGLIKIVGLNILKKLEKESSWSGFVKSLGNIEK